METKKNRRVNLENKRWLFFQAGMIAILAIVLLILEWKSPVKQVSMYTIEPVYDEMTEIIQNTFRDEKKVLPPPPVMPEELILVDNNEELKNELLAEEFFVDEKTPLDIVPYEPEDEVKEEQIFRIVEDMPRFMGGNENVFRNYVNTKLRYPAEALNMGMTGTVHVQFIINKKGELTDVKIVRATDPLFEKEVMRVLSKVPLWTPGKQRGKPVNVAFNMPFYFKLQ